MKNNCSNCKYAHKTKRLIECRRMPPVQNGTKAQFPTVEETFHCGEFKSLALGKPVTFDPWQQDTMQTSYPIANNTCKQTNDKKH